MPDRLEDHPDNRGATSLEGTRLGKAGRDDDAADAEEQSGLLGTMPRVACPG